MSEKIGLEMKGMKVNLFKTKPMAGGKASYKEICREMATCGMW